MRGINKVTLIGQVGHDPDVKELGSGRLANISLATSEQWKDKQTGERKERTEWHKLICFGKLADIAEQYVVKGSKLYVEGSLNTKEWQDKAGVRRFTTQIVVSDMQLLSDKAPKSSSPEVFEEYEPMDDEQIPF